VTIRFLADGGRELLGGFAQGVFAELGIHLTQNMPHFFQNDSTFLVVRRSPELPLQFDKFEV